jgi:hypothetical protein
LSGVVARRDRAAVDEHVAAEVLADEAAEDGELLGFDLGLDGGTGAGTGGPGAALNEHEPPVPPGPTGLVPARSIAVTRTRLFRSECGIHSVEHRSTRR